MDTPYFIYMLRCGDGSVYTGITTDLERRLSEHSGRGGKGAKYTGSHEALHFEAVWSCAGRSDASRLEYRLKRLTKRQKEHLISGMELSELLPELSGLYSRMNIAQFNPAFQEATCIT